MADLTPDARQAVQRILDAAARRVLAERSAEDQDTPSALVHAEGAPPKPETNR